MATQRFEIEGRKFAYLTSENAPDVKSLRQAARHFGELFQCEATCVNGHSVIGFCEDTGDPVFENDRVVRHIDGPIVLEFRAPEYDRDMTPDFAAQQAERDVAA